MSEDRKEDLTFDFSTQEKKTENLNKTDEEKDIEKDSGADNKDIDETSGADKNKKKEPKLSPLKEAEKKAEEAKTQYLYLRAEFENYKKNMAKEQMRLLRFGSENLILDILKISDLFSIALQTKITKDNFDTVYSGFKMTAEELSRSLETHGLKKILTKDKKFDPHLHEAIGSEICKDIDNEKIIKECKPGYMFHDKLIRPSQVIVSKKKSEDENKDNEK